MRVFVCVSGTMENDGDDRRSDEVHNRDSTKSRPMFVVCLRMRCCKSRSHSGRNTGCLCTYQPHECMCVCSRMPFPDGA